VEWLQYWWIGVVVGAAAAYLLWRWLPRQNRTRGARFAQARREFHLQRERLEAKFVQLGTVAAKPDAPRWTGCEFDDDVAYARNRTTGELNAFVGVTIEIDEGDDSSGAKDAIGNLRAATAIFRLDRHHWETDGRALFNLTPVEAIRYFRRDLELLGEELAGRR
jgi:hypothetical protein